MARNRYIKFLDDQQIAAPLLREFLAKELWRPAVISADETVEQLQRQIVALRELQEQVNKEANKEAL
jgi:hypothetical protein